MSLVALAIACALSADAPLRVVVPNLEAQNVDAGLAASLTSVVLTRVQAATAEDVLGQGDIERLLLAEQQRQLLGCGAKTECLSNVAGLVDASRLVWGSLGRLGERYVLTLSLLDTASGSVTRRVSRTAREDSHLSEAASDAVHALFVDRAAPVERCVDCAVTRRGQVALKVGNDFTTFFRDGVDVSLVNPALDFDVAYRVLGGLALTFNAGLSFGKSTRTTEGERDDVRFQFVPLGLGARYYVDGDSGALYAGASLGVGFVRTALEGNTDTVSAFASEVELGALYGVSGRWSLLAELTYGLSTNTPDAVRSAPINAAAVSLGVSLAF